MARWPGKQEQKREPKGKPELILCRDEGRVTLFLAVNDGHLQTCGTPGVNWRYMSPKSICLGVESNRGRGAGGLIEMAQCMAKMTGYRLRDELVKCDIRKKGMQ